MTFTINSDRIVSIYPVSTGLVLREINRMNGWSTRQVPLVIVSVFAGIYTDEPVTGAPYPVSAGGALNHVVRITASDVTKTGTITAKLQTAIGSTWQDSKTVEITADGTYYIKLLAAASGDQTYLPLLNQARVVLTTTDAGDAVTITDISVLQET